MADGLGETHHDRYGLMLDQTHEHVLTVRSRRRGLPILRMLIAGSLVVAIAGGAYPLLPRYYVAYADVLIRPTGQSGDVNFTPTAREALDDNAVQTKIDILHTAPLQRAVINDNGLLEDAEFNTKLKPPSLIRQVAQWLRPHSNNDEAEVAARLVRMLDVRRDKHSYVLRVGYETSDPDKAARLTNALTNAFVADGIEQKRKLNHLVLNALQRRVDNLQIAYQVFESLQHAFLVSSGLIHRSETESLQHQLATLSTDLAAAHNATVTTNNRSNMLTNAQRSNNLESVNEGLVSPLLQHLRERLIGMTSGAGFGTSNAPSGANEAVIGALKTAIGIEMLHVVRSSQNDAQVAVANETALRDAITHIDERLTERQSAERQLDILNRRVEAARAALVDAMTRYDQQSHRDFQPDVEVVSLAVPSIRPSFPNLLIYLGGMIMLASTAALLPILPRLLRHPAPR